MIKSIFFIVLTLLSLYDCKKSITKLTENNYALAETQMIFSTIVNRIRTNSKGRKPMLFNINNWNWECIMWLYSWGDSLFNILPLPRGYLCPHSLSLIFPTHSLDMFFEISLSWERIVAHVAWVRLYPLMSLQVSLQTIQRRANHRTLVTLVLCWPQLRDTELL